MELTNSGTSIEGLSSPNKFDLLHVEETRVSVEIECDESVISIEKSANKSPIFKKTKRSFSQSNCPTIKTPKKINVPSLIQSTPTRKITSAKFKPRILKFNISAKTKRKLIVTSEYKSNDERTRKPDLKRSKKSRGSLIMNNFLKRNASEMSTPPDSVLTRSQAKRLKFQEVTRDSVSTRSKALQLRKQFGDSFNSLIGGSENDVHSIHLLPFKSYDILFSRRFSQNFFVP